MSCRVKIAQGILEGKQCISFFRQKYFSFEGIPYAKPPVGKLRFRAPQELEPWVGVRTATAPGNKCAQINPFGKMKLEGSEDCLYLNVYTPSLPEEKLEKLPVLFFVHGGRFMVGYGDYYRPDYLIRHSVILVTINYRLSILGFLCLHTPEVPGNAGIKDTIMALKWVKNNIIYFNGDQNNIVAMGDSAGGGMVSSYMTSKMANGLVDKIICHSGNLLCDLFIIEADEIGKATYIAKGMGADKTDKNVCQYLTNAPIEDLMKAVVATDLRRSASDAAVYFVPVVEKEFKNVDRFIEEHARESISGNRFKNLPILTTVCSHEGGLFVKTDDHGQFVFEGNLQCFIPRFLSIKNDTPRALRFADNLRKYYFKGKDLGPDVVNEYLDLISDAYFGIDTTTFLEMVSARNVEVYFCFFSFCGNLNTSTMRRLGVKGASHGDLLQYIFYKKNKDSKYKGAEKVTVDTLTEAWCNFAKTGKPTWTNQQFEWLPYKTDNKYCLSVGDEMKLVPHPHYNRYKAWVEIMYENTKMLRDKLNKNVLT